VNFAGLSIALQPIAEQAISAISFANSENDYYISVLESALMSQPYDCPYKFGWPPNPSESFKFIDAVPIVKEGLRLHPYVLRILFFLN
jgi:hypothetical protein